MGVINITRFLIVNLFILNLFSVACSQSNQLPKVSIGKYDFYVEIANSPSARERGLMFRNSMPVDKGMFFVFPKSERQCFWMKNTYIPLTAIFIDDNYKIINYSKMMPFDESTYCSTAPAKYVLEINQGVVPLQYLQSEIKVDIPKNIFAW